MAFWVNKLIAPRQLELTKLADQKRMLEIADLEAKGTDEAKAQADDLKQQMANDSDPTVFTAALAKAWQDVNPEEEKAFTLELLKYVSSPVGVLGVRENFKKWLGRDTFAHLPILRQKVIEYNRFFDLMQGLI
jgi:hypothetical protein